MRKIKSCSVEDCSWGLQNTCCNNWSDPADDMGGWMSDCHLFDATRALAGKTGGAVCPSDFDIALNEILWCVQQMPYKPKNILEIGLGWGYSTRMWLCATNAQVTTVDMDDSGYHATPQQNYDSYAGGVAMKAFPQCLIKRWEFVQGMSVDVVPDLKMFDFVFIDGDHSYESVLADLKVTWSKLKSGGILSGHDYKHPPVYQAVTEFCAENGVIAIQSPIDYAGTFVIHKPQD